MVLLTQKILNPPAGGGNVLKKVLFGEAPPQGSTPYLLITYHFWQKMCPFRILSIVLRYPFHIPSLELCIHFTAVIALSLKCHWINHKTRKFSQPQNASVGPSGPAFYWPKWPLPFHVLQQVKSLPVNIPDPESWERYPFRAEPLRIDHYREYLPSGSNPNRYSLVMGRGCT